ncbi:HAD family hydrolase [Clostridium sp. C8-1-8]|uniref:HAD family hydrolase n=1 Tax=Clostridium sp. C8-1-8 TaxID=2698831 RepID=UPI00137137FF|nr:HAD family hydrolase [Clostridium sp. C8-1-8]
MYKNFIFDLYGTLINIHTNESKSMLWKKLSLFYSYNGAIYKPSELKQAYLEEVDKKLKANNKTEYPDIKLSEVFKKLYEDKGIEVDEQLISYSMRLFRGLSTEYISLYPGVKELLTELKATNKKIYMLSNGQREFTVPELKYLGIHDYFDGLYSSSDIEICKPDKAFFDYLINNENLDREESIFIGNDHLCDVEGAKAASLDCLYIHSNQSRKVTKVDSDYLIWDGDVSKILKTLTSKDR